MKKSAEPPADYVVGQVCGSLFPGEAASSGSLSALFSTTAPAAPLLFQPAPKPVQKSKDTTEQLKETPEVKGQTGQKKKQKLLKEKSEAEQKLENRELSLQNADDDERTQPRKNKRKAAAAASGENPAEQWVMKRQKLKAQKEQEALKRSRTVFVGNLPVSVTRKTLQRLFRDKGSIESIRFRSVIREDASMSRKVAAIQRKVHPKRQSVNAYVVFKDEDGVSKALERNGLEIQKDFYIRVDRVLDGSAHDHKRSVFVGNLPFEINELAFRRHFQDCGSVEAVRLVRDQNSGLGKGFGYVLFESADSVQLALELDGSQLEGRSIRVKRSVKKEKQKKPAGGGSTARGGVGRGGGSAARGGGGTARGPGPQRGGGGFKSPKKFPGKQQNPTRSSNSFKGEMVDPTKKSKKKGQKKKKGKPKKTVHI